MLPLDCCMCPDSYNRYLLDMGASIAADKSTVFADGFRNIADGIGAGVLARKGQVYFTNIQNMLFSSDLGEGFTYPEHVFKLFRKFSKDTQSQKLSQKRRIF